jgi:hypothetical protein
MTDIYYKKLMFFSHFNAGLRVLDVRNPFNLNEVAYFVPAINKNTVVLESPPSAKNNLPVTEASNKKAIQTNNVEVDDRGYIYIVDRANTGMHILSLTGKAREIANWSAADK